MIQRLLLLFFVTGLATLHHFSIGSLLLMSALDQLLDEMDDLMDEFNASNTPAFLKLKAQYNLLALDLDLEKQVNRNHEKMLHMYDCRIHELDDKVDRLETELTVAEYKIQELEEQLAKEKRQRLMDQWLCDTVEEFEALEERVADLEMEEGRERKRLRTDKD